MGQTFSLHDTIPIKVEEGTIINLDEVMHKREKTYDYYNEQKKIVKVRRYYYHLRDGTILLLPWSCHQLLQQATNETTNRTFKVHVNGEGKQRNYTLETIEETP